MDWINWLFAGGVGLMIIGCALIVWAAVTVSGRADDLEDDHDGFTPSMQRYGYVQDARNKGEL